MTKIDKLKEKFLRKPRDIKFSEVRTLLEHSGFKNTRTKGSHFFFTDGVKRIVIPSHNNKVKKVYIEEIIKILDMEE
ncbi:MAG: type II toxin-antitoxin system HicA family toxin [Candidatus Aminicenantes bacterium]|nr:type II toxin-antitoxin system HicA family toxin [Candidatus Aminicenantes bacterium]